MSQQINLYDPSLRPRRALLTASSLAVMLCGMAVVLLGYYALLDRGARREEQALAQADARLTVIQNQATKQGVTSARAKNKAIEESITKAETELRIRQALLDRLKGGKLGNTRGFSEFMAALARQRTEGIWITGLAIADGGTDLRIQGGVIRPELLSEYIRALSREEVMKGKPISDLRIERKEIVAPEPKAGGTPAPPAGTPAPTTAPRPRFIEFTIASGPVRVGG